MSRENGILGENPELSPYFCPFPSTAFIIEILSVENRICFCELLSAPSTAVTIYQLYLLPSSCLSSSSMNGDTAKTRQNNFLAILPSTLSPNLCHHLNGDFYRKHSCHQDSCRGYIYDPPHIVTITITITITMDSGSPQNCEHHLQCCHHDGAWVKKKEKQVGTASR